VARLLTLIAAAAIAVAPASAVAKKHRKPANLGPVFTIKASGPVVSSPAASSNATATCPAGLQAISGGFTAPFTSSGAMVVTQSYRSAPGSWSVSGTLVSGTGAATAYAYCRRNTLRVTDVARTGTLPSGGGQSVRVEADCARKAVAISGGFQMTTGPQPAHLPIPEESTGHGPVLTFGAINRNWQVVAQNSDTGEHSITAHAYCATGIEAPAVAPALGTATVPFLGSLTETSVCPSSTESKKGKKKAPARPLSSGGFVSPFTLVAGVLPVHSDSRIAGISFIDTVVDGGGPNGGEMTTESEGMCL
jgi:hypothetical protein